MKSIKGVLASLAAASIVLSQPASAASMARGGSSTHDTEQLAGTPSAALPAIIAILAVAIVAVIAASGDDDVVPTSP